MWQDKKDMLSIYWKEDNEKKNWTQNQFKRLMQCTNHKINSDYNKVESFTDCTWNIKLLTYLGVVMRNQYKRNETNFS